MGCSQRRERTVRVVEEWRVARNGNGYLLDGVVDIRGYNVILPQNHLLTSNSR